MGGYDDHESDEERAQERDRYLRQALDALVYSIVVVVAVVVGSGIVSFPLGFGWVGVKYVLFFLGFFTFGISAFFLRPTPPWKDSDESGGRREESRFQAFVQRLPPDQYELPPDDRLPTAAKLFIASVLMLVVSFVMETSFGVVA